MPADLLGQPDLPHLPGPPYPGVLPVRARPPGPGGMARRAGLRRLPRACPSPPAECAGCGASHAELWRIQCSYDEVQIPGGQTIFVPRAPLVTVNAAVSVCVDAVTYPVARAFALLGRGASSTALHHLVRPIRTALTLI